MSDSTSRSDGLCDRCANFLHFRSGEHGFYAEYTGEDGTVRLDLLHTKDGRDMRGVESHLSLEDTYPAMTKLRGSASQGCGFCRLLVDAIKKQVPKNLNKANEGIFSSIFIEGGQILAEELMNSPYICAVALNWRIGDSATVWHYRTCFKILANQDTMAAQYLKLLHTPSNPLLLCSENIASIRQSLSDCSLGHKSCVQNGAVCHWNHQALPSRLLRISKDQTGYKIRLTQMPQTTTSGPGTMNPKYVALSYCWGDQKFLTTTPENITDHYDSIKFSELPQGFQDTIELCWEIGIFYLWIDSLCIIQGDKSDWDRESARMKDVYANAFLTIVIASTSSPLEGLSNGATEPVPETRVSYHLNDANKSEITYFIQSKSSTEEFEYGKIKDMVALFHAHQYHSQSISTSRWNERGWTFQESYLSTRKLFIGSDRMDFSCKTYSRLQGVSRIYQPLRDLGPSVPEPGPEEWYGLVGQYSGRKLSRLEDKLPAISAVASLKGEGRGNYVAGLWTKDLEKGLLWTSNYDQFGRLPPPKRQTKYRGPTWSWCTYDGFIRYFTFIGFLPPTRAFDILEVRWTLAEPSAIYGRLSTADGERAYLRIRAKVAWVTVQSDNDGYYTIMEFDKWGGEID